LQESGLDVLVVDLTTDDLRSVGVHAVRVLVPGLVPVNSDHRWPFLGGTASNVKFRYPTLEPSPEFPSPFPHPLG
jgi:ribosomal protein S12 methylthiotransferase accessory factor